MKVVDTKMIMSDVGTNAFSIETDEDQIKLHTIVLAVAKKGFGKSYFLSNLLKWLKFDRIIVISPTFESNQSQFKHLNIQAEDIFDPDDPDVIKKKTNIVNQERDDLVEYRRKLQIFKELKKLYGNPTNLDDDYTLFDEYIDPLTHKWKPPEHKYNGKRAKIAMMIDDAQSTAIFRNKAFINLALKHRHLGSMPGDEASLGISLFIAVQSYTSQGSSLPRSIRNNTNCLALWRSKNIKELTLISEEMAGSVSPEKFMKIYDYIMEDDDPHTMMFVDLHKKQNHPSGFRKNYTQFIVDE